MENYQIVKKPVLTEKSYVGIQNKRYVFYVDVNANKLEIKKAVEELFNVKVDRVNVLTVKGKEKSQNTKQGRTVGTTAKRKKAYVTLKADSKPIAFFESLS